MNINTTGRRGVLVQREKMNAQSGLEVGQLAQSSEGWT